MFRYSFQLSGGQIRKMKQTIFSKGNVARISTVSLAYEITDDSPVMILGLKRSRGRRDAVLSRTKRFSSYPTCGAPYEYLVDMNIFRDRR